MKLTQETLSILVFLAPGLISSVVLSAVVIRKTSDTFSRAAEALIFSFFIYIAIGFFEKGIPVTLVTTEVNGSSAYQLRLSPLPLIAALGLALALPLLIGLSINKDVHMKLLRLLATTNLQARESTWTAVLSAHSCHVVINLSNGNRLFGWPQYSSRSVDEGLIYLQDPAWVTDDGKY
ncbi:MAG: hypothetical protein GY835_22440 [bacterium]|nr:hypothetical protein [bacterium]